MNYRLLIALLTLSMSLQAFASDCALRQSTASQELLIGPFLDSTDGVTPETALTISNTDIRLSPAQGNMVAKNTGGATHDELGEYQIVLNATDTATVGILKISVAEAGALPVWMYCYVYEEAVYDAIYASGAIGIPSIPTNWITAAGIAADAIGSSEIAAAAIGDSELNVTGSEFTAIPWNSSWDTEVQSEADDALVANHLDHLLAADYDPASQPGVSTALLNELIENNGGVSRYTAAALAQAPTGAGGDGSAFTAIPWNSSWDTEVQSEVNDALVANHLDHLLATDYDPASPPGVSTALLNELIESNGGVSRYTAAALAQAPTGAGGDGSAFTAIPWNASWDAEVQSEAADALNAYDPPTNTELNARTLASAAYFDPSADTVANVTLVATTTTNTDMRGTDSAATAANLATVDSLVDAIKAITDQFTFTSGHVDANTDYFNDVEVTSSLVTEATIADAVRAEPCGTETADTLGDLICNDLESIPGLISALNDLSAAAVNAEVDTALSDYDGPTKAELDAAIAAIDTLIDAIKAKTDSLTFTVSGQVDANAESMNGAEILGDGTSIDKWRGE